MVEVYGPYVAALLVLAVVVGLAAVILLLNRALGPRRPTRIKGIPYESGVDPADIARHRFSVSFYMTAILFIVFDLEVVFIYPWAVNYKRFLADKAFGGLAFGSMLVFLAILAVGLLYEYKRGAMSWQ